MNLVDDEVHMIPMYKSISTGAPKIIAGMGAGWAFLGAPVDPPLKFGPDSHTGAPKMPVPIFFRIHIM
jgi:hypothetical protein